MQCLKLTMSFFHKFDYNIYQRKTTHIYLEIKIDKINNKVNNKKYN